MLLSGKATSGLNCYAVARNAAGLYWSAADGEYAAYASGYWPDYAITAVEDGATGNYHADGPSDSAEYEMRRRVGSSPAESDPTVWTGDGRLNHLDADISSVGSGIGTGDGDTAVNHNTGGVDALSYKTPGGTGIDNAIVRAFLTSEYAAGDASTVRARTTTDANGRWVDSLFLNAGISYTIVFEKPGVYGPDSLTVTA